eukprot:m.17167 g.17167  ORF g.17167 m.17167 type:complete len:420 (+) comp4739_c0_seq1:201-1460(+)
MSMNRKALPILLLNLNCELLYVINERLVSQNAPESKTQRIRDDIAKTIFDQLIVDNMFMPQPLYDQQQLLTTTKYITNSSIITLNGKSLTKLFDLMTMVFKYQLTLCTYPKELLGVTLNHLDGVTSLLNLSKETQALVDKCKQRVIDDYASLSNAAWHRIRHAISTILQDKHTRVALFQQAKYQGRDGRFHIPRQGPVPPGCQPPGIVTYGSGGEAHQKSQVIFHSKFTASTSQPVDIISEKGRGTALGENLYLAARDGRIEGVVATQTPLTEVKSEPIATEHASQDEQQMNVQPPPQHVQELQQQQAERKNEAALKGLELLAGLVGGKRSNDNFPLIIFKDGEGIIFDDDEEEDIDVDGDDERIVLGQSHSVIEVDAKQKQGAKALLASFDVDEDTVAKKKSSTSAASGDDLLDLFDL